MDALACWRRGRGDLPEILGSASRFRAAINSRRHDAPGVVRCEPKAVDALSPTMGNQLRQLAIVDDYDGLLEALRDRAEELDVSRATLDAETHLQKGYSAKLLCGMKGFGRSSTGPLLQKMGLVLIVAEDVEATERLRATLPRRQRGRHRPKEPADA